MWKVYQPVSFKMIHSCFPGGCKQRAKNVLFSGDLYSIWSQEGNKDQEVGTISDVYAQVFFCDIDDIMLVILARWLSAPIHFWHVSNGILKSGCRWKTEVRIMTASKMTFPRQLRRAAQRSRRQDDAIAKFGVSANMALTFVIVSVRKKKKKLRL